MCQQVQDDCQYTIRRSYARRLAGSISALVIGAMALQPAAASAPDAGADDIPNIIVTATRTEVDALQVPASIQSLSADQMLLELQTRSLPEALRTVPGVMVQKTGHAQGSPYIRGFTGFHNLLLIDGIRVNNAVFRDGPNQYWNMVVHRPAGNCQKPRFGNVWR